jgi:DNA-binding XRE family transcriptional regulator
MSGKKINGNLRKHRPRRLIWLNATGLNTCQERRAIKMSEFKELLAEQMKDEEFRKEYEALEPEFTIMQAMIDARNAEGMTQKELSERSGIAQGDISKMENGNANPSIKTLQRLAEAMGKSLRIEFV